MTERLALLRAILAAPDDDLPRLVFADWLEEHGTTDADAARVEFIRLGCRMEAKAKMASAEGQWLGRNWKRLLPGAMSVMPDETKRPEGIRKGRFLWLTHRWREADRYHLSDVKLEFNRGFVLWAGYATGQGYQRVWRCLAPDEPLTYHRPAQRPHSVWTEAGTRVPIAEKTWGTQAFRRLIGSEATPSAQLKQFAAASDPATFPGLDPVIVAAEDGLTTAQRVARASIATAMTAIAREYVGLADPSPGG